MLRNRYFAPSPITKAFEFFGEKGPTEKMRLESRKRKIEEGGFIKGLKVRWLKKKSVICVLKDPSKDWFLLFEGACIKGNPDEWELVE